jgi:hypothetical protein
MRSLRNDKVGCAGGRVGVVCDVLIQLEFGILSSAATPLESCVQSGKYWMIGGLL